MALSNLMLVFSKKPMDYQHEATGDQVKMLNAKKFFVE